MTDNITQLLQEAIDNLGLEEEVSVRSYSGRGMYGKECCAITGSMGKCQLAIAEVQVGLVQELFEHAIDCDEGKEAEAYDANSKTQEIIRTLAVYDWDSMGLDVVVYWPGVEYTEPEEGPEVTREQLANQSMSWLSGYIASMEEYFTEEDEDLYMQTFDLEAVRNYALILFDRKAQDKP